MADRKTKDQDLTPREALTQYERAVKDNSNDAQAHLNLASAYYVTENFDAALSELQTVLKLTPNSDHAHYYLGVIYTKRGDVTSARQEFACVVNGSGHLLMKNQAKIQLQTLDK